MPNTQNRTSRSVQAIWTVGEKERRRKKVRFVHYDTIMTKQGEKNAVKL